MLSELTKAEQARLLTDLKHQRAEGDWKPLRKAKAQSALKTLQRIAPPR
jgi:hypothetical protein